MTSCQGETLNSHPTGICGRLGLGIPVLVTRALTTILAELKNRTVYNRHAIKRDTQANRGTATMEATQTIIDNVYQHITS